MSDLVDFALVLDDSGIYDIDLDPNTGDVLGTSGFNTSIILSLATDQRAASSEIVGASKRRGFIGDEFFTDGLFKHGSKLWLLDQSRATLNTKNLAVTYSKNSLEWLVDDGYARSITAKGSLRPSGVDLLLNVVSESNSVQSYSYNVWSNTLEEA